jgi:hypothetical protein
VCLIPHIKKEKTSLCASPLGKRFTRAFGTTNSCIKRKGTPPAIKILKDIFVYA